MLILLKFSYSMFYVASIHTIYNLVCEKEKKSSKTEADTSTSSIKLDDKLLILFHQNSDHKPYILCTINPTTVSYKTSLKIIQNLSTELSLQFDDTKDVELHQISKKYVLRIKPNCLNNTNFCILASQM